MNFNTGQPFNSRNIRPNYPPGEGPFRGDQHWDDFFSNFPQRGVVNSSEFGRSGTTPGVAIKDVLKMLTDHPSPWDLTPAQEAEFEKIAAEQGGEAAEKYLDTIKPSDVSPKAHLDRMAEMDKAFRETGAIPGTKESFDKLTPSEQLKLYDKALVRRAEKLAGEAGELGSDWIPSWIEGQHSDDRMTTEAWDKFFEEMDIEFEKEAFPEPKPKPPRPSDVRAMTPEEKAMKALKDLADDPDAVLDKITEKMNKDLFDAPDPEWDLPMTAEQQAKFEKIAAEQGPDAAEKFLNELFPGPDEWVMTPKQEKKFNKILLKEGVEAAEKFMRDVDPNNPKNFKWHTFDTRPRSFGEELIDELFGFNPVIGEHYPSPHKTGRLSKGGAGLTAKELRDAARQIPSQIGQAVKGIPGALKDPKTLAKLGRGLGSAGLSVLAEEGGLAVGEALSPHVYEPLPGPATTTSAVPIPGLSWMFGDVESPYVPNPSEVKRFGRTPGASEDEAMRLLAQLLPDAFGMGPNRSPQPATPQATEIPRDQMLESMMKRKRPGDRQILPAAPGGRGGLPTQSR